MKRLGYAALIALLMMALSGCGDSFTLNPQELYALPKLPAKYTQLSALLGDILSAGAEYAAPTAGSNIQSVQLIDLDGDGREEAVACLRRPGDEKPLKICVFTAEEDSYRRSNLIEGSGTAIYSVAYTDLDGDGRQEIAVGWKAAPEMQVLEIYPCDRNRALVRTDYVKYVCADLDGDGRQELAVLHAGEDGDGIADYYVLQEDGTFAVRSRARISTTMAELSQQGRVRAGTLAGGTPALFATGVTDQMIGVTDILTIRNGEFVNISLDRATGFSGEISPFRSLYPTDMNGDGITEVPCAAPLASPLEEESAYHLIEWRQYQPDGTSSAIARTYHAFEDGWYLRLPAAWTDKIYVTRTTASGESCVTFSLLDSRKPFLRVFALTGSGREMRAIRGERFVLSRQLEIIYSAELLEESGVWEPALTDAEVRGAFALITREWLSGDN